MEHLPPASSPYRPISVPYIDDAPYDGLEFAEYPRRRGFDLDLLLKGDFQGSSPEQVAGFLQTWLYFGLMHGVLGVNMKIEDFVRTDDDEPGMKWLTTEKLPGFLHVTGRLIEKERTLPEYTDEYVRTRNIRIEKCFRLSLNVWEGLSRLEERYSVPNPLSPEVALGIQVLAITLQVGATEICGGVFREPSYRQVPWESGRHWRLTRSKFLQDRMVAQGWCPTVLEHLWAGCNVVGQYYASLLGPPPRKIDHSSCSLDSKDCQGIAQLPVGKVVHQTEGCQCGILTVDASKLEEIIRKDEIPVLRLVQEKGNPALEVVSSASEPGLEYTAMSHVWTDGWGNPTENSLPTCRVEKIIDNISATYSMPDFDIEPPQGKYYRATKHDNRVFFWMDTLCVPRKPDDIYKKAIVQMRDVYTNAERVLVYDAELIASTAKATYEEINMRIFCSRWIRRLWTVQEAVLAKRLIYQFDDGPHMYMTGSILWFARQIDLKLNYFNTVGWDCTTSFEVYDRQEGPGLIAFVWSALLTHRSVTFESDEAICGAILLNLDMKRLLEAPVSDRMKTLWTLLGDRIPIAVLFVMCPRLQDKGFSWAPSSLLPCEKAGIRMYELGHITDDGLRIKFAPYTTFEVSAPRHATEVLFPCTLQGIKYFIKKSPITTNPSWEGLDLHNRHNLAVIIEMRTVQGSDMRWSVSGSRGALVSIVKREGGILFAEYLRVVSVVQEDSSFHRFPTPPWTALEVDSTAKTPSEAKWIEGEQEWCFV